MNSKNKINIFIVEDNKVFTLALKADIETEFANKSITIYSFETGEKCMEKFKEIKPQLVILDFHLNTEYPDAADGIKVLDWIKKQNKETNVIMLTSNDNLDIAIKSFKHGASDYVVKTETQFKKINFSLLNIFKIMKARREAEKYKFGVIALIFCLVGLIGVALIVQMLFPTLF